MATLRLAGRGIELRAGDTVLDALLRAGEDLPWSCRKGICQSCVARRVEGAEVPADVQGDLKATLRAQGCFLACLWKPESDTTIARLADGELFSRARVADIRHCGGNICRVFLDTATPLFYHAGQFINLRSPEGLVRSYSIASVPTRDTLLELHVRKMQNGRVSGWMHDTLRPGDLIEFEGPHGHCFYLPGNREQPLLLAGTGTGAAPLIGIARDALASGHAGDIHFYHGVREAADLYLHEELRALAADIPHFHYHPAVTVEEPVGAVRAGRITTLAFSDHPKLAGWRVYVCGNPDMVKTAKKKAYLAGAALKDIYADAFELVDLRQKPREAPTPAR